MLRKLQFNLLSEYMSELNSISKKFVYKMYTGFYAEARNNNIDCVLIKASYNGFRSRSWFSYL